jgi:uncharacterized protein YkwD
MYRVLLGISVALLTTGCGMGSNTLSSGFAESPVTAARASRQASLGSDLAARTPTRVNERQRTASLSSPSATSPSEHPTKGALSGRDYSRAAINPEAAREAINNYRRSKGLKPLKLDAELTTAARAHAQDLAKWDRISHYGSDGSNPWDRVKRTGYNAKLAAENVGTGQATFDEVLKGWQDSPGHNKNLLQAEAQHMGLALVHDPKTEFKTFWTLVIGSRL